MAEAWRQVIVQNVAGYKKLRPDEQRQLEDDTRIFIAEKDWDGGQSVEITDEIKLTIAAQACLMLVGFRGDHDGFANVRDVVVLESTYSLKTRRGRETTTPTVLGHTTAYGPVFLAWDAVRHGGHNPRDGRNLVYHEFAHKLDFTDHLGDGTPDLDGRVEFETWVEVMTAAYQQLCDRADRRRATLLDTYGAINPAEFFAVATECFFEKGSKLKQRHPDLYRVLSKYYQQDPAAR